MTAFAQVVCSTGSTCDLPASSYTVSGIAATGNASGNTLTIQSADTATNMTSQYDNTGIINNNGILNNGDLAGKTYPWLRVMGPNSAINNYGTFNNSGEFYAQNVTDFSPSATPGAGVVFNAAGATLNNGSTVVPADMEFYGTASLTNAGTFNNYGSIYTFTDSTDNSSISNSGTFVNYAAAGNLNLDGVFSNTGALTNVAGAGIEISGNFTNGATGTFTNNGQLNFNNYGSGSGPGTITNQGKVIVNAGAFGPTSAGYYPPGNFIQQIGGSLLVNGQITANSFDIQGGTVSGVGTLGASGVATSVTIDSGATMAPGSTSSPLTVDGTLNMAGTLQLNLLSSRIGQAGLSSAVNTTGTTNLSGNLQILLANGFSAQVGDYFDVLSSSGGLSGALSASQWSSGGYTFQSSIVNGTTLQLAVTSVTTTSAGVPAPMTMSLFALTLFGLGALRKRRWA